MSDERLAQEIQWLKRDKYDGQESPEFFADIRRLEEGEPLAYVIGWIPFLDLTIDLSSGPLIPRPETEFWTKEAILELSEKPEKRVLDIFAGSGCVGLALLSHLKDAHVTFADIEGKYLDGIVLSASRNDITPERYKTVESDLFSKIDYENSFDLIVANPPYIPEGEPLDDSVAKYEPSKALYAEDNGLFLIDAFLQEAQSYLAPGGVVYLEHGFEQQDQVVALAKKYDWPQIVGKADQYGTPRYVHLST